MPTELKSTIKREIKVYGVSRPVIAQFKPHGIEMSLPGFKIKLEGSWDQIAKALSTPLNVPSYLEGKPMDFLRYQADKLDKKGADKLDMKGGEDNG